ncbi:MAG TPA: hypothetical protein VL979_13265 [Solirubrobacteraceae bacterium]|nr:hypothetical protein [Solirubrobacteraceae bacterium]
MAPERSPRTDATGVPGGPAAPPGQPAPTGAPAPSGQSGALAIISFGLLVGAIVAFLALGHWWGFAVAIALTLVGVLALSRYVERIAWTRRSPLHLRRGLRGMNEDLSVTDDSHAQLSPLDLPLDNPAHHELQQRLPLRQRERLRELRHQ